MVRPVVEARRRQVRPFDSNPSETELFTPHVFTSQRRQHETAWDRK
jgi:hypothetical protein